MLTVLIFFSAFSKDFLSVFKYFACDLQVYKRYHVEHDGIEGSHDHPST
jgi:hypothetical protein